MFFVVRVHPFGAWFWRPGADAAFCTDGCGFASGHHAAGDRACLCGRCFHGGSAVSQRGLASVAAHVLDHGDSRRVGAFRADHDSGILAVDAGIRGGAGLLAELYPSFHSAQGRALV